MGMMLSMTGHERSRALLLFAGLALDITPLDLLRRPEVWPD
jgi:hypothetical protein